MKMNEIIKKETRKNIFDHFDMEGIHFSGRMEDIVFLNRLYDLKKIPSEDGRYSDAAGEIWQHTVNNNDYEGNWVFADNRFELLNGSHETFLKFICEMAHPLVRPDKQQASKILAIANDWLREDGWELYPIKEIAGGKVLSFQQINAIQKPKEDEVSYIWEPNKLRFFISHRDEHKAKAKKLGEDLSNNGISCFVAHDSIQAMSTWKDEIMKALLTMDAFVCYITDNFYKSEWTNQEIGFAIARNVPIYLYSVDGTDPLGFKLDTQAIKTGLPSLITCIKKDFSSNLNFKKQIIQSFVDAKNGSFSFAKDKFYNLLDLKFIDSEIEVIANAFSETATHGNQLWAVLNDGIKKEHESHPRLRGYSYYREYLNNDIFSQHSTGRYKVQVTEDKQMSERVSIVDMENL